MGDKDILREQLAELLHIYCNGSFSQMACEYIHTTGMTKEEVEKLLKAMKEAMNYEI